MCKKNHKKLVGTTNSRYLGRIFDGWLVDWAEQVKGGHQRFYLTKRLDEERKFVITVRDNELTKLNKGLKTMEELLINKAKMSARKFRPYHNSIRLMVY